MSRRRRPPAAAPARGPQPAPATAVASTASPVAVAASVEESGLRSWLPMAALAVVATFALRRLDDFDTWWHLASGRWIAQHASVPHTDVLSFTSRQNEWINLQWLYDLLLYAVHAVAGVNGLVLASTAAFVGTFALLARHLRRHVGPVASTLLLLWVATTVNERFLIRPEMASFPLLAAVQLVLAAGRREPSKLRLLVPLMVLWSNMHSLFILGVGSIVCQVGGALVAGLPLLPAPWRRDSEWPAAARRELFVWGGAAIAATALNPYFLRALVFPLELMTRIDGSSPVYGAIGEFRRPFSGYFPTFAIGSYQAFLFAFGAIVAGAALVRAFAPTRPGPPSAQDRAGFDVGALAFAAALAWLSLLARRNIGIFAIGAVPFFGACAGILLGKLPPSWTSPRGVVVRAMAAVTLAASLAVASFVVTNQWYANTGETHEFGLGVFESNFQPRATAFFREQKLPGPAFNDMTAGGYLTWDEPTGQGVYVDGRLEVYDTPFFAAYMNSLGNPNLWRRDADARGIQSVMVFHRWGNRHPFLRMLASSQDWRLVYYDETAAIFVRASGNEAVIDAARSAFTSTWRPKTEAFLSGPAQTFSWQWSIDRYTGELAYARVLETLGEAGGAQTWFEKAVATGLPPDLEVETRQRLAQYAASAGQLAQARMHLDKALAADPDNQTTRAMLGKLDALSR